MLLENVRTYCLSKPGTTEGFPFDDKILVFKVVNKIFALSDVDNFDSINLKCDPELAIDLRERYDCVQPGYHMSKKHWNTVVLDNSVSDKQILDWIDHSYQQVVKGLTKKEQASLGD